MKIGYRAKLSGPGSSQKYLFIALYGADTECLIATGEKLEKSDWDEVKRLPRGKILTRAALIMAEVEKAEASLKGEGHDITPFTVKQLYDSRRRASQQESTTRDKQRRQTVKSISTLADEWTANHLFGYKHSSQKSIRESIRAFQAYLQFTRRPGLQRGELNHDLITRYERYLLETKKLSNNTHGKRLKHLRWFLKFIDFDTSKIKLRTFQKPVISLDLTELEALEAVDVSDSVEQQKAKDLFLLGCYTGQRISDLKKIRPASVVSGELRVRQTKTGKDIFVPITSRAKEILKRYEGSAPKIAEQHLNEHIKTVCKRAGITATVIDVTNKAGMDVRQDVPKHQLITSHIAGKTFISTVATERHKMSPPEIAAICGKNLKTLLTHYFSLPRESAKQKMLNAEGLGLKVAK
jgi:integrase